MKQRYPALSVTLEEDLLPLSALLHSRQLRHQVYEENDRQVLAVEKPEHVEPVQELHRAWREGKVSIEATGSGTSKVRSSALRWRQAPVTVLFALLSVAVFLLLYLGAPQQWIAYISFMPFEVVNGRPVFSDMDGQYWRLITPAFLHFGWLHIVFNCLWLWELGNRIERVLGSWNTLGLLLVIAAVSNVSQYIFGGPGLFGGMSGVVYGLLGFAWVAPLLQPAWPIQPVRTIMLFMVGWLVLCLFGVVEVLGFGAIANAAHVGGLLCGGLLGALFGALSRFQQSAAP